MLGLWFQQAEGAKFWLAVLNELRQRGVRDVLVCCVDGLKGFPEAIEAIFPNAWVQTCIVHLIRQSLRFVPDKHRRAIAKDLKPIYTAVDADTAAEALAAFEAEWGERYLMIGKTWREAWEHVIPFLAFPPDVRGVVYTTDESVKGAETSGGDDSGRWIGRGGCSQGLRAAPVASISRRSAVFGQARGLAAQDRRGDRWWLRLRGRYASLWARVTPDQRVGPWGWEPRRAGLPLDGFRVAPRWRHSRPLRLRVCVSARSA